MSATAEKVYIESMDVKERIILLGIIRQIDGAPVKSKAKAFKSAEPHLKVGEKVDAVMELSPANGNFPEEWIVKPVAAQRGGSGGGGGSRGPAQSDPVKNAIIQKANENNNAGMKMAANLKAATACFDMAVTLLGAGAGINEVRAVAFDISTGIQELAATMGAKS
jgi:hypothetical protein